MRTNTVCLYNLDFASQWNSVRLDVCSALITMGTVLLPFLSIHIGGSMPMSPAAFGLSM